MNYVLGIIFGTVMYTVGYNVSIFDTYLETEEKIIQEMKDRPTQYNNEFSFGYSVGLIRCSRIASDVKEGRK